MFRNRPGMACWVAFAVGGLAACAEPEAPPPPPQEVGVVEVAVKTVPVPITRVAQTESSREVEVVARVSGFLDAITYDEGSLVQEGDVLFEMDPKPFKARLEAAQGELSASRARLYTANANLSRTRPLAEADAMSQSDLDTAIGEKEAAEAAVYSAKANVTQAELDLSYTTIKAPVTGLTGQAKQRQGAYLNAFSDSAALTYVAQIDPIWVNFSISQNDLENYQDLQSRGLIQSPDEDQLEFDIKLGDGREFPHKGRLDFTAPSFDNRTGTFTVRAVVPNPDYILRPGMFVTAIMRGISRPDAVVVPQKAVQKTGNGHIVWLAKDDGTAEARPVTTGDWVGDEWVIEEGLTGGESLIVEGFRTLRPGANIKAVPAGSKASQAANPANTAG